MPTLLFSKSSIANDRPQLQYPFRRLQEDIVAAERAGKSDEDIEIIRQELERSLKGNSISPYLALAC